MPAVPFVLNSYAWVGMLYGCHDASLTLLATKSTGEKGRWIPGNFGPHCLVMRVNKNTTRNWKKQKTRTFQGHFSKVLFVNEWYNWQSKLRLKTHTHTSTHEHTNLHHSAVLTLKQDLGVGLRNGSGKGNENNKPLQLRRLRVTGENSSLFLRRKQSGSARISAWYIQCWRGGKVLMISHASST